MNDYDLGVTFDPSDPSDIAHRINGLLENAERLQRMRTNALRAARDIFNFEREGNKLLRIVEGLIGPPNLEANACVE